MKLGEPWPAMTVPTLLSFYWELTGNSETPIFRAKVSPSPTSRLQIYDWMHTGDSSRRAVLPCAHA